MGVPAATPSWGARGWAIVDYDEIERAAKAAGGGVLAVGNFAIIAALLQRFAIEAAKYPPAWEIIDTAYAGKMDAPSGMARELAWRLYEVWRLTVQMPVEQTVGDPAARGTDVDQSRIHSVRLPGYTIGLEVRFGKQDKHLTLQYDAGPGAAPCIAGTLLAVRRVQQFTGVVRGWIGSSSCRSGIASAGSPRSFSGVTEHDRRPRDRAERR